MGAGESNGLGPSAEILVQVGTQMTAACFRTCSMGQFVISVSWSSKGGQQSLKLAIDIVCDGIYCPNGDMTGYVLSSVPDDDF